MRQFPPNGRLPAVRPRGSGDASPGDILRTVGAAGHLLSATLSTVDSAARAWHWGSTDPSGFAAVGVNETLLHTYDITQGLGVGWLPPAPLCAGVLAPLFADAPAGDPARVLLWCTGRGDLAGQPRVTSWVPRAAEN